MGHKESDTTERLTFSLSFIPSNQFFIVNFVCENNSHGFCLLTRLYLIHLPSRTRQSEADGLLMLQMRELRHRLLKELAQDHAKQRMGIRTQTRMNQSEFPTGGILSHLQLLKRLTHTHTHTHTQKIASQNKFTSGTSVVSCQGKKGLLRNGSFDSIQTPKKPNS